MTDSEEEIDIDDSPQESYDSGYLKTPKKVFSKLATELSDDDLKSQGVQKLLLAEIRRLENTASHVERFREKFHTSDKECAVLKEKSKIVLFSEILYSVSLTVGAVLLGLMPSIEEDAIVSSSVIGFIGGILIIGAIVAKVIRK